MPTLKIMSEDEIYEQREAERKKKAEEAAKLVAPDDPDDEDGEEDFDADFTTGLTVQDVRERTDDLEQLSADFILNLIGAEDVNVEELGFDSSLLSEFMDLVELFLAEQGVQVFRPAIIKEKDGTKHIVYSKYDNDLDFS